MHAFYASRASSMQAEGESKPKDPVHLVHLVHLIPQRGKARERKQHLRCCFLLIEEKRRAVYKSQKKNRKFDLYT